MRPPTQWRPWSLSKSKCNGSFMASYQERILLAQREKELDKTMRGTKRCCKAWMPNRHPAVRLNPEAPKTS